MVVLDIEMPKSCAECSYYNSPICRIDEKIKNEQRLRKPDKNCPLKEHKCENTQNELNLLDKIEKLINQISEDNQLISDLRKQLAVAERALFFACNEVSILEELRYGENLARNGIFAVKKEFVKKATAELKAEKGEGK